MMIFKRRIPRRAFLRGLGATVALPFLDGMVPAFAGLGETAGKAPVRLGIVFVGNGMWPMDKWTPKTEGTEFELSPTLEPLKAFRDKIVVLSGLAQQEALTRPDDPTGEHTLATSTYLTGVRPHYPAGEARKKAGISMDQIAAQKLGKETQVASLELSLMANHDLVGLCENNESCVWVSTLSWSSPTTPLPMATNPRAVFERLFGDVDSTDRTEQLARMRQQRSILDGMAKSASRFLNAVDPSDRAKLNEYLDAIRDIERRIQIAEAQSDREMPKIDKPSGVPVDFDEYAKLMMDLQTLAYQADLTRVITFQLAREGPQGGLAYPHIGLPDNHHNLSHHGNDAEKIAKLFRINVYHSKLFAYFLEKLQSVQDGDGSLLDHTVLLYGSSLSNGNIHQHDNLPLLLAGGARGQIKGGRHLRFPDLTPMTNLHLTLLDMVGVPVDKLGDSTGQLKRLPV
jgi:Protein of unknown function (DUF1552)